MRGTIAVTSVAVPPSSLSDGPGAGPVAFRVTPAAVDRLVDVLAPSHPSGTAGLLRAAIQGGGCSGFKYHFDVIEAPDADDWIIEAGPGVRIAIDPVSAPYLDGSELDFKETLLSSEFVVRNPNAHRTCGCGQSFS